MIRNENVKIVTMYQLFPSEIPNDFKDSTRKIKLGLNVTILFNEICLKLTFNINKDCFMCDCSVYCFIKIVNYLHQFNSKTRVRSSYYISYLILE